MIDLQNNKAKQLIWLFVLPFFCIGCNPAESNSLKELNVNVSNNITLELDSVTTNSNPDYQFIETDSMNILALFNAINNSLYYYNFDNKSFVKKLKFETEGPNGVGSRVTNFHIYTQDSIVIHSYYLGKILAFDGQAKLISSLDVSSKDLNDDFLPQSGPGFPLMQRNGKAYMTVARSCNYIDKTVIKQKGVLLRTNLNDNSKDLMLEFPKVYFKDSQDQYWPSKLCNLYYTENEEKDFVVSYPLSDSVTVLTNSGSIQVKAFSWPNIKRQKPIKRREVSPGPMGEFVSYLRYTRYTEIFYDPFKQVYLRKVELATPKDLLDRNQLKTEMYYLVADKEFNVLGFFKNSGTGHVFFTKDGMNQVKFSSSNEDVLTIKVLDYELE